MRPPGLYAPGVRACGLDDGTLFRHGGCCSAFIRSLRPSPKKQRLCAAHAQQLPQGEHLMRLSNTLRTGLIALIATAGVSLSGAAMADSGTISLKIVKAGFVIGGSAGSGTLRFHGRNYPLSIGGLSYGFTFGASETRFHGRVTNIRRASDVAGGYWSRAHESASR